MKRLDGNNPCAKKATRKFLQITFPLQLFTRPNEANFPF
jgi:hypothetical protein